MYSGWMVKILALLMIIAFNLAMISAQKEPTATDMIGGKWQVNGHHYTAYYIPDGVTWDKANAYATKEGGYLATIASPAENEFVYNLVADEDRFWFLDSAGNGIGPWLGGYQMPGSAEPNGGWAWANGESMNYANWATGQPDNYNGIENRMNFLGRLTLKGSTWNDYPMDSKTKGFIVESG